MSTCSAFLQSVTLWDALLHFQFKMADLLYPSSSCSWNNDEVRLLIAAWGDPQIQRSLDGMKKNLKVFRVVANSLKEHGIIRTALQCRAKIKRLRSEYKKALDSINNRAGADKNVFKYFEEMHRVLGARSFPDPEFVLPTQSQDKRGWSNNAGSVCEVKVEIDDELSSLSQSLLTETDISLKLAVQSDKTFCEVSSVECNPSLRRFDTIPLTFEVDDGKTMSDVPVMEFSSAAGAFESTTLDVNSATGVEKDTSPPPSSRSAAQKRVGRKKRKCDGGSDNVMEKYFRFQIESQQQFMEWERKIMDKQEENMRREEKERADERERERAKEREHELRILSLFANILKNVTK